MTQSNDRYFVQSIERAFHVLEALSRQRSGLKLVEIAASTGMDRTTAIRVLRTLEHLGYVVRHPDTKRYSLGVTMLSHGLAALSHSEAVERARPFLVELFERFGETVDLGIRDGRGALIVVLHKAQHLTNIYYEVGTRIPLHCSAVGKCLIQDWTRDHVRDLLGEGPYMRFGPNSPTCLDELMAELAVTRRQKYAVADAEVDADLIGVAAPIRDSSGAIAAALSITSPRSRMSRAELETRLLPAAVETARRISQALGAQGWTDINPGP